ncbi:hypothetical protein SOVF_080070 [Spinacia oleracea]|uniref:Protein KINESIN LIGHT CHAIN-RELATED 2 n=1 Tax=Spinacia oleracea TaxID=3562 RepID=A0A9R0I7F4_SPIOL|nr:protein KINESIN LIGHT CHAIN-RELATED 2-like [Spinacia oleracea]KNA17424.1 hypothetical protein SOVF_080070 [Spinacia oleracea]
MLGADMNEESIGKNSSHSGSLSNFKRSLKQQQQHESPISPLSPGTPSIGSIDLSILNVVDNSIDHLYRNICDMESSDESQSTHSFTSCGNESRIDSELRHLVGADNVVETEEDVKEVVVEEKHDQIPQSMKKKKKKVVTINMVPKVEGEANNNNKDAETVISEKPPIGKRNTSRRRSTSFEDRNFKSLNSLANNPDLGPYLLKKARDIVALGDNPKKAFELALRAKKSFESCVNFGKKPNLDYVSCLHLLASMHSNAGKYKEAVSLLEHSNEIPNIGLGQNHALAKFVGCMQLGDIYAMMGQIEKAVNLYKVGLEIQKEVLGDKDPRFGETCRYVAEAYIQTLEFDEAEKLCKMALDIHKENGCPPSVEEAADRRLMGLICESKGDYEVALEHYVLASTAMHCSGQESDVAAVDCNIGDVYLALARYDEAISCYKKALTSFTSSKGKNHTSVASVFVRLGELYNKVGKFSECKSYCESALEIYCKPPPKGSNMEDIANGLTDLSAIYESMNELDMAFNLLNKALELHGNEASQKSKIAGIEAQMGVLNFMLGNYEDSYNFLKSSVLKFEASGEKKSSLYAITLNQLGLACVQLYQITEASELFDKARSILEKEYGLFHPDTLGVYSNLAGTYDALGRWDDAVELLELVVVMREEKLGTADPIVDDEKRRLAELLNEAGKARRRYSRSLETLFDKNLQAGLIGTKNQFSGM